MKLKELRLGKFLSQADLSELSGIAEATINRLEKGIHRPKFRTIRKLARALGVNPQDIEFLVPGKPSFAVSERKEKYQHQNKSEN